MKTPCPSASLLFLAAAISGGCVSPRFQLDDPSKYPPVALQISGDSRTLPTRVETVIVPRGPGSWKRDAYWDEYVLSLHNRGGMPVTVLRAELVDAGGTVVVPGRDWQKLEEEGRARLGGSPASETIVEGSGAMLMLAGKAAALPSALIVQGLVYGAAIGSGGAAILALTAAASAFEGSVNASELKVAAEFDRRRISLPARVRPGETLEGSLFFTVTPSPRALVITYRENGTEKTSTVRLAALAELHGAPARAVPVGETLAPLSVSRASP